MALSWNPNLQLLAGDIARLTNLPQHYYFDLSTFQVVWDHADRSEFVAIIPDVTMLTDGNVEDVLALAEKRGGGDVLVAVATYWIDRTVYETMWDSQGQACRVAVEPPRQMEEPRSMPAVDVGASSAVSFLRESVGMAGPGNTTARSFGDPSVRAAFESQENEVVRTQRGAASGVRPSVSSTLATGISPAQPVHEGIEAAHRPSAEAPQHQAFFSPQPMRDDFHNPSRDAAARARLDGSEPLGYLNRESLRQGADTEEGRTLLSGERAGLPGAPRQTGTASNQGTAREPWGHLNREGRWVME